MGSFTNIAYKYFFNYIDKYENDEKKEKVFKMSIVENGQASINNQCVMHYFHGVIKSGSYGVESELVDSETGSIAYHKERKHADVMPFNFSIYAIDGSDTGVLVTQSISVYGVTTLLRDELSTLVRSQIDPDAKVIFVNVAAKQYLQRLFDDSSIKEISLVRYASRAGDKSEKLTGWRFESDRLCEVYERPKNILKEKKQGFINSFLNRTDIQQCRL